MKQDEIIEMAKDAGFERVIKVNPHTGIKTVEAYASDSLERFAKLVAAKEREACLSIAESMSLSDANMSKTWRSGCRDVAESIRTRGEA